MVAAAMTSEALLDVRGVVKHFGRVQALNGVDLEVHPGAVVALLGDNGAGKSTLVKIVAGVHQPDAGEIRFDGRRVHIGSPKDASAPGIETVYQDLGLCDNLSVVQNLFLRRGRRIAIMHPKRNAPGEGGGAIAGRPLPRRGTE